MLNRMIPALLLTLTACAQIPAAPTVTSAPPTLSTNHAPVEEATPTSAETHTPIPTRTRRPTATPTVTPTLIALPTVYETLPGDWQTYTSTEYGFSFQYPPAWSLEETPAAETQHGKFGMFIRLTREALELSIGVKHAAESDVQIGCTGTGAGDTLDGGSIPFMGAALPIVRLVFQDKLKTLYFERPCADFVRGALAFFIAYRNRNDYREAEILPEEVGEVTQILATFRGIP